MFVSLRGMQKRWDVAVVRLGEHQQHTKMINTVTITQRGSEEKNDDRKNTRPYDGHRIGFSEFVIATEDV